MDNSTQVNILADEGVGRGGRVVSGNMLKVFGIFAENQSSIEAKKARQQELQDGSEGIVAKAESENRDLNPEELDQVNANASEAEKLKQQIDALERVAAMSQGRGRQTISDESARNTNPGPGQRTVPATARLDPRTFGFKHLGEFASACRAAASNDQGARDRLFAMNEGVGEDGGFLVPPEFRDGIMQVVEGEDSLLSRCDMSTTSRNSVTQNMDETTPWGTGGIIAYWEGEAQAAAASGAKLSQTTLRLNKLFARVDVTDELLEDAPQLDNYLRVKAPEVMTSVINLALISGNGVGKPLGIMNSGALVTVAKETSQPADTLHHRNVVKMMSRMYAPCWPRSVWLMNQDVFPQLHLLAFRDVGERSVADLTAAVSPTPAYMPPSTLLAGAPFGTLLGRPILPLQGMETLGDLGDIILADMTKYRAITKSGGARVDTSIHLKFDTDETVFRFIFRLAGAPWWSKPITPRDGNNTLSAFVTLATR